MNRHAERAGLAETPASRQCGCGMCPSNVPSFAMRADLDPFTYLGFLAARTERLRWCGCRAAAASPGACGPRRRPAWMLSGGRIIPGVVSGDRRKISGAGASIRRSRCAVSRQLRVHRAHGRQASRSSTTPYGMLAGDMDMLPKPVGERSFLAHHRGSQQSPDWIAGHGARLDHPSAPGRGAGEAHCRLAGAGEALGGPAASDAVLVYRPLRRPRDAATDDHLGFRSACPSSGLSERA